MAERRYLPTVAELIDRLSIIQLKEVFITEHKEDYAQEIQDIVKEIDLNDNFSSQNMGTYYKIIIGPINNETANKLVSTFISKGYKETGLILE